MVRIYHESGRTGKYVSRSEQEAQIPASKQHVRRDEGEYFIYVKCEMLFGS